MKRKVLWSKTALEDFKEQITYIATDNPSAARRVATHVKEAAVNLGEMAIGRPGRVTGTYERVLSNLPYILVYALAPNRLGEAVVILRLIHTSQDWPRIN